MKRHIAMISYHTCPLSAEEGLETGGMNVYVRELATRLAKSGYVVDVFTRDQGENTEQIVEVVPNFRVIHIEAGPHNPVHRNKLYPYIPEFTEKIYQYIQSKGIIYDLLDCHYYLSGIAGESLQQMLPNHPQLFMTFHRIALMKNLITETEDKDMMLIRVAAEMRLVQQAAQVISPSTVDSKYLQYLYNCPKEKISVITPGVDTKLFYPQNKVLAKESIGANKDHTIILFVARIEPDKGIDTLMYAFKMILEKCPQKKACLWIVGGDTSQPVNQWSQALQKLEALRKVLGIETSVTFIKGKHSNDLPEYYNAADLVVIPSYYESFGMIALEAMACAVPVIATNTSGVAEILEKENEELVISANNPFILSDVMCQLISHPEERKRLGEELLKEAQTRDWDHIAQEIMVAYEKILQ